MRSRIEQIDLTTFEQWEPEGNIRQRLLELAMLVERGAARLTRATYVVDERDEQEHGPYAPRFLLVEVLPNPERDTWRIAQELNDAEQ